MYSFKEDNPATIFIFPSRCLVFLINQHLLTFTVIVNVGTLYYSMNLIQKKSLYVLLNKWLALLVCI